MELDDRFVEYLPKKFPALRDRIIHKDFLEVDLYQFQANLPLLMLGNFPYNISTQIMFKIIEEQTDCGSHDWDVSKRSCAAHRLKTQTKGLWHIECIDTGILRCRISL